jgi:hypothetical protein
MSSPFPYPRPYWKGYSREQDQKLVLKVFYGITIRDKQTGRDRDQYLSDDSPEEREGRQALCRLLSNNHADPEILAALCCALTGRLGRRLVFKNQRKGKRDAAADFQVALHVEGLRRAGWKNEAAVEQAMKDFGLSRKAVFEARKRVRHKSPWLKS